MTNEEMTKRCKEAVGQTRHETPSIVAGMMAGLIFDCREWNLNDHQNLEEIELQIGRCYAGLKMLEIYTGANPMHIQNGVYDVLRYS